MEAGRLEGVPGEHALGAVGMGRYRDDDARGGSGEIDLSQCRQGSDLLAQVPQVAGEDLADCQLLTA